MLVKKIYFLILTDSNKKVGFVEEQCFESFLVSLSSDIPFDEVSLDGNYYVSVKDLKRLKSDKIEGDPGKSKSAKRKKKISRSPKNGDIKKCKVTLLRCCFSKFMKNYHFPLPELGPFRKIHFQNLAQNIHSFIKYRFGRNTWILFPFSQMVSIEKHAN